MKLDGVPTKVALFVMGLPHSDGVFVVVYPRECAGNVMNNGPFVEKVTPGAWG